MPRVPYEPFPTAQPVTGGERVNVQAPPAAFGVNVGAALENLGATGQQVGNELFTRAIALQDLANENAARQAQSDFAQKSSELHAQFGTLTGKAAADGLSGYLKAQNDLRTSIRGQLGSPMAQKYYDADSLPFMQRNVFSGAAHAADENKKYTIGTYAATTDMAIKAAGDHPTDTNFVNAQRDKIVQSVTDQVTLEKGVSEDSPIVKDAVMNAVSKWRKEQISGVMRTDPTKAQGMLDQYADDLTGPDKDVLTGQIQGRSSAVFAANFATDFYQSHLQPDGTLDISNQEAEKQIRAEAATRMPGNPFAPEAAVQKYQSLVFHDNIARREDKVNTINAIDQAIGQYGITDTQQLLAIPGMDKTVEKLAQVDPKLAATLQQHIFNINQAANRVTRDQSLRQLNGMKNNDLGSFLTIDPFDPKWHLNVSDANQIQKEQQRLVKDPKDDPKVTEAMRQIKGAFASQMQALGLMTRDKNNPDDYDHFTGALQEALTTWREDHNGKPPGYQDLTDKIFPQLIRMHSVPGMIYGTNQEPTFRGYAKPLPEDVPDTFRNQLANDVAKAGGTPPTDTQVYQAYLRTQFIKLFGGSAGAGPSPAQSK